jgi:hypothetical protein
MEISKTIEERWQIKCDLCGCIKSSKEQWNEEHCTAGGSGFNFTFCCECSNNRQHECDAIMGKCISNWIQECRDYWKTHPEELARHNKETEEYRKTLKS